MGGRGSGLAGGGGQSAGGGQHLAPSCGRYASCVHAGGLSCLTYDASSHAGIRRMSLIKYLDKNRLTDFSDKQ